MRRGTVFLFILCLIIVPCFGLIGFLPQSNLSIAETVANFQEFNRQVVEETSSDDFGYTYISKNADLQMLEKVISNNNKPIFLNSQTSQLKDMSFDEIQILCNENDYLISEEEDCYSVRNKYSSQRIITIGNLEEDYNARKVITGYEDVSILCYDSIEDTKYAYQKLLENESLTVMLDSVMKTTDFQVEEKEYDYSGYKTWGAEAMDLGVYNEYLSTYGAVTHDVVVAVLDTGINTSHVLFKDRILTDENGDYVGFSYHTTKYTYSGEVFEDDKGHGTHVSGTICELTPQNVKILPIKVLNYEGKGYLSQTVAGIGLINTVYSLDYQILCANMSLGGECSSESSAISERTKFDAVFNKAREKNILSIVSAGNDRKDTFMYSPANCQESAIVVSALQQNNGNYLFDIFYSNYGETVDISAPGTSIKSAYIGNTNMASPYVGTTASGTSMASPHVSAAVALLCLDSMYYDGETPFYTADEIQTRLFEATVDLGDVGKDVRYGHGMVNLKNHAERIAYEVDDCTVTYDGGYHNISVTATNVSDFEIKYGLSAGTYNITDITKHDVFKNCTDGEMAVYFILSADRMSDTKGVAYLTINQAEITAQLENQSCTYGDVKLDQTKYSITSSNVASGDTINYTLKTSATNKSNKGSYAIKISCDNDNYKIKQNSAKLSILPREVTIKLDNQTFTYGDKINLDENAYQVTDGKIVNGDDLGLELECDATSTSDADEYELTLSAHSNKNYTVNATAGKVIISKRPLKINIKNQSSMYGDKITLDNTLYEISQGKVVNNDDLGVTLKTDAVADIGKYSITLKSYTNTNYDITAQAGEYQVTKREIQVTVEDQTFTYGEDFTLDTTKYKVTKGSVLTGDNLNATLSSQGNSNSDAGEYAIDFTYSNDNYSVELIAGKLIILQREIHVSIPKISITYGDSFSLEELQYKVTNGTIIQGDLFSFYFTTDAEDNSGAGEYEIKAICANENYKVVIDNDTLTINPRKLVLKSNQTSVYGDFVYLNNKDYEIVEGEIINNDALGIKLHTSATSTSDVGSYDIYATLTNGNYEVEFTSSEYTITKRPISIKLNNQKGTYGDEVRLDNSEYTIIQGNIVNGDDLFINLYTNANQTSGIGYYKIKGEFNNSNYDVSVTEGEYVIYKRVITIRLLDQTVNYSFNVKLNNKKYEVVEGSLVNEDDLDLTLLANVKTYSFVGSYVLTGESNNNNYEVTIISGVVNVQFSWISFMLIFLPLVVVVGVGFTLFFLRRHYNRNKYLRD